MELALEIGVIIIVFLIGYRMGFKACYEYLMTELQKHKKDSD